MYKTYNYIPSFVNVIKPKKTFLSSLASSNTTKSIETIITGAQKLINVYEKAMPIINQSKPMIDNIKSDSENGKNKYFCLLLNNPTPNNPPLPNEYKL